MRICTRSRDAAEYIQKLEAMVITMAVDISNLLKTADSNISLYTAEEIVDDYAFVTSEPSVLEEVLYQQDGIPYLKRESILAYLIRIGVVVKENFNYEEILNDIKQTKRNNS